ncbi:MAG: S46 family peptidase [Melioribacteraceae bacterium]|nr:S46 family peptidase [Melioribacteraceae bacterium]
MRKLTMIFSLIFLISTTAFSQFYMGVNLDTVKAQKFDTGKMWTFENPPVEYFEITYGFKPTQQWLDDVRLSALKFATWCTASFVSEDGLIMTNHHCVDFVTSRIQEEGEDINANGFYASSLDKERKVSGVFVDQLVYMEDVTDEVIKAIEAETDETKKIEVRNKKIAEIEERYNAETGLRGDVVRLYNGGKFSLYGYKRYEDIRAVYFNESDMGFFGGDPDNFTYPRYDADFAFLRAYDENGVPLKVENYFKFSPEGPKEGEPLFVIGNPGSTQRLATVSQLEYLRDVTQRNNAFIYSEMMKIYNEMVEEQPERFDQLKSTIIYLGNSKKVVEGIYRGLLDPIFIARKKDFEKTLKEAVISDPELNKQYGHIWDAIAAAKEELRTFGEKLAAYNVSFNQGSQYFAIANDIVKLAKQLQLPEEDRGELYKEGMLESTVDAILPDEIDHMLEIKKLRMQLDFIKMNLGEDNELVKMLFDGMSSSEAAEKYASLPLFNDKNVFLEFVLSGPDAILSSDNPLIKYVAETIDQIQGFRTRQQEINKTEQVLNDQLGRAVYAVYGTSIPPDASFTLRIGDGVMKSYNYNGTIAPTKTTFHGMYDRYYSFNKEYPWKLPERWLNPTEGFDPSTPYNFISTHDIVGGSSGSAVINKNAELVGIAFDGNIESIPGNFLYSTEANRMVSVHSEGIMEILKYIGKADRILKELETGKIPEEYYILEKAE